MEFVEGLGRATEVSKEVIAILVQRNIPPTPKVYTVLYAYIVDANPDLTKEINSLLAEDNDSLVDILSALYDKHYGSDDAEEAFEGAVLQMEGKIGNILEIITAASGDNKDYGEALQVSMGGLKNEPNVTNIALILNTLVDQTESILNKNEMLQGKLEESTEEINNLRKNLGTAKQEALIDGLTAVANRKCFDIALKSAVNDFEHSEKIFCVAMVDIDHFKIFNDTFGHQTGDKVLKAVAQIIRQSVRDDDIVARYGGEEFAIILPDITLVSAFALCERMRVAVSRKKLRNRKSGQDLGRINVSIGISEYRNNESASDLLKRADGCLYHAKENGRNMTIQNKPMLDDEN